MMKKAKMEMETLGKILLLTAFLIMFLLMFKGCQDQMKNVGTVGINEYLCWLSHALKADITFLFPSACYAIDIEEPQEPKQVATLIRKCWWMHGQGEKDILTTDSWAEKWAKKAISWYDIARTCYLFTPKDDISIDTLEDYLRNYDRSGKKISRDNEKTAWAYVQKKGSDEKTGICFDKRIERKLLKGKRYFIIFYDDRSPISTGRRDRILISRDPGFGVEQTGFWAWISQPFVKEKCENWQKRIEEEAAKSQAKVFFDKLTKVLQECIKQAKGNEACICDNSNLDPLNEFPKGYTIQFKKLEGKKYEISLLDENKKVYKEKDKEFKEVIEGARLGSWSLRERDRSAITVTTCLPGIISDYKIDKYLKDYYIIYNPNNQGSQCCDPCGGFSGELHNPKEGDYAAVYLVQQDITGFKKCSEIR